MDVNPPASPDISANYAKPPSGSSWPWPSFPAALGLVSLPGRKNVARVTVKGPEGARPVDQSNCIIM